MHRRSFLELALVALPLPLVGQTPSTPSSTAPSPVAAGADREAKMRPLGPNLASYKVLTRETGGGLFVMEETNRTKGGPPLHLHHAEDELFYVLEGEYIVQVGEQRSRLKTGDCVLGPRGIPHAFARVGESTGRLLISYAPAGKMEAFFNEITGITPPGKYANDADMLRAYGMEAVGPQIPVS